MDKIVSWIDLRNDSKPFFIYTNLQGTHMPLTYTEDYDKYKPSEVYSVSIVDLSDAATIENRYDNAISYVDAQVGRLMDSLERNGVANNTVIILTSDHGHDLFERHGIGKHGNSVYNEELTVPLIIYFPDIGPMEIDYHVSHIDVLPTVVDLLGLEMPEEFLGRPMQKDNRFFFYAQSHKYIVGMLKGDLKVIIDLNKRMVEIYDVRNDFNENNNLIEDGHYDEEILEVLMWHSCQNEYFARDKENSNFSKYCDNFLE